MAVIRVDDSGEGIEFQRLPVFHHGLVEAFLWNQAHMGIEIMRIRVVRICFYCPLEFSFCFFPAESGRTPRCHRKVRLAQPRIQLECLLRFA